MNIPKEVKLYHVIFINIAISEVIWFEFKSSFFMHQMFMVGLALIIMIICALHVYVASHILKFINKMIDKAICRIPDKYTVIKHGEWFGISKRRLLFAFKPICYYKTVTSSTGISEPSYEILDFEHEYQANREVNNLNGGFDTPITHRHYCDGALLSQDRRKKLKRRIRLS